MLEKQQGEVVYWYFRVDYDNGEKEDEEFETQDGCLRYVHDFVLERAGNMLSEDGDEGEILKIVKADAKKFKDIGDGEAVWTLCEYLSESYDWGDAKLLQYGRTNLDKMKEAVDDHKDRA